MIKGEAGIAIGRAKKKKQKEGKTLLEEVAKLQSLSRSRVKGEGKGTARGEAAANFTISSGRCGRAR
jgi:hypothetical protein